MPFILSVTDAERTGNRDSPPRPDQFAYVRPAEVGGAEGIVRFTLPVEAARAKAPPAAPKPSFLDRLLGRASKQDGRCEAESGEQWLMSEMVPALKRIGARTLLCRYDGGDGQGFAWLERVDLADGGSLDVDALCTRLEASGVKAAYLARHSASLYVIKAPDTAFRREVRHGLADIWASMLLGEDFGTGDYLMFGAFTVDLDAMTITDDPAADPVVESIELDLSAIGKARS